MEFVCRENDRPLSWFYEGGRYIRKTDDGKLHAAIKGINLPDPLDILEMRTRAKTRGALPLDARVHADPITVKLWEHWNANADN